MVSMGEQVVWSSWQLAGDGWDSEQQRPAHLSAVFDSYPKPHQASGPQAEPFA